MAKYILYNQTSMVVINFIDQIQPGTFKNDNNGRPTYDPSDIG